MTYPTPLLPDLLVGWQRVPDGGNTPEMRMSELEASAALPLPARCVRRHAWRNGSTLIGERTLAEEVPVAFSYDGAAHAVLMATPDDLEDLALGFSYTEGIISAPTEIAELAVVSVADGIVLRMWLTGGRSNALAASRR